MTLNDFIKPHMTPEAKAMMAKGLEDAARIQDVLLGSNKSLK